MNITYSLIFEKLCDEYSAESFWNMDDDRPWKQPAMFDDTKPLEKGRMYIAESSMLPVRPEFSSENFIICIGEPPRQFYFRGNFPFIQVKGANYAEVFNYILDWFIALKDWEVRLHNIIEEDADLRKLTEVTIPFIGNPIAVLDSEFYHVAITEWQQKNGRLNYHVETPRFPIEFDRVKDLQNKREKYKEIRGLFQPAEGYLCINLFMAGRFMGNITLAERWRQFRKSDEIMLVFFAEQMTEAFHRLSSTQRLQTTSLKSVIRDLLNEKQINEYRITLVGRENQEFVCFKLIGGENSKLPPEYICWTLEEGFEGCSALIYEDCIICVIDYSAYPGGFRKLTDDMKMKLEQMYIKAGVSGTFSDIRDVLYYYKQAYHAFFLGQEKDPEKQMYFFYDYLPYYFLKNCTNELPLKYLLVPELQELKTLSQGGVDYLETLKCYLENNMNVSVTARELFLHRSTLMHRLEKIESIIGDKLNTKEIRLMYQVLLMLMDYEKTGER